MGLEMSLTCEHQMTWLSMWINLFWSLVSVSVAQTNIVEYGGLIRSQRLAAQVCSGLMNRATPHSLYIVPQVFDESNENEWYQDIVGHLPFPLMWSELLSKCVPFVNGYILYDYTEHQLYLPQIITLAGVYDLLPLESNQLKDFKNENILPLAVDAQERFMGMNSAEATLDLFYEVGNLTTILAFKNQGYNVQADDWEHKIHPELVQNPHEKYFFVDYMVKQRAFDMFLTDACTPFTEGHRVMREIVNKAPPSWNAPPLPVWGYASFMHIAGDIFEATTRCVPERLMGSIPSASTRNLAYWSSSAPLVPGDLRQSWAREPTVSYDSDRVYVVLVLGDMDNLSILTGGAKQEMAKYRQLCASPLGCPPLTWGLSPHAAYVCPDILRWFYDQLKMSGSGSSVSLPPSGVLYSYPGGMNEQARRSFVEQTEAAANVLNTTTSISWEFMGTWQSAMKGYFPLYSGAQLKYFFALNVPYLFPISFGPSFPYTKIGPTTVFKPLYPYYEDLRFIGSGKLAALINALPLGTITYVYVQNENGLELSTELPSLVSDHVEFVSGEQLENIL